MEYASKISSMPYEYLIFNFLIIIGPFLVIIFSKTAVKPLILPSMLSISLTAMFFLIWDHFATGLFWIFNEKYITGLKITNLPVEEILFFLTVPFACLLLHVNLMKRKKPIPYNATIIYFTLITASLFLALYCLSLNLLYSGSVLLALCVTLLTDGFILKTRLLFIKQYYIFLMMLFTLTFIFNYYLTARPVLIYNPEFNTNLRVLTIPVEDFIYSFILMLMTTSLYEYFKTKTIYEKNNSK